MTKGTPAAAPEDVFPPGVDDVPGARALYEEFHAARAARSAGKTRETCDRFNAAAAALDAGRIYWRQIRQAVRDGIDEAELHANGEEA